MYLIDNDIVKLLLQGLATGSQKLTVLTHKSFEWMLPMKSRVVGGDGRDFVLGKLPSRKNECGEIDL